MTCIRCRVCHKVIIDDVFKVGDDEYKRLIDEHFKIHNKEEMKNMMFYMSDYNR